MARNRISPSWNTSRNVNNVSGGSKIGTGLGPAPSGFGIYDELFANNPYRNLNYNKSAWQKFLSGLGFRTDADRFEEEAQMNALQTDFGIFQQMYQDEYNSELAKAQRMREAGENPDLLGTSQVSEASSPMEDPQGMTPGTGEEQVFGQAVSGVISCFSTAAGIASQIMQLDGIRSDIESKNIGNAERMMQVIQQRVLGMTPADGFKTDDEFNQWRRSTEAKLRSNYGRAFFKGSSLRRWNRSIDDFIGGLPTSRDQYKAWRDRMGDVKEYFAGHGDFWSDSIDVLREVFKEINDARDEYLRSKSVNDYTQEQAGIEEGQARIEEAKGEQTYHRSRNYGLKASAENKADYRTLQDEDFQGVLSKHLNKIGQKLDEWSKQGGFKGLLSEIALFFFSTRLNLSAGPDGISGGISLPNQ